MIGMNMQFGIGIGGFGGGILQRAMMMSQAGMAMSAGISMPGMSMGMSMGIGGLDRALFSPEAMMGGGSNFFHPLMSGGMGGFPQIGAGAGMGMVPGMCCPRGPGGIQNQQQQMMMLLMLLMMMMMMKQMGGQMGNQMGGMVGMPGMGGIGMAPGMSGMGAPMMGAFAGVGPNGAFAGAFSAVPGGAFAAAGMGCRRCGFGRMHPRKMRRIRKFKKKLFKFIKKILKLGLGAGMIGIGMGMGIGVGVGMFKGMF